MDDLPSESFASNPSAPTDDSHEPDSSHRSPTRVHWIRAALTVMLVAGALTVLLSREDPTFFYAAQQRISYAVSPPSTQAAPTPSVTRDLMALLPVLQQRSLKAPALAAGEPCVATPGKRAAPELGSALGNGPVYMVGYGKEGTTSYYNVREDGGWYYLKTIWTTPPDFQGIFLLRGRQVDGPNDVRFSEDTTDTPALQAVFSSDSAGSEASGWLPWIDYVRVRAPGCYGIQVDGLNFSYIIRFTVLDTPYDPQGYGAISQESQGPVAALATYSPLRDWWVAGVRM
jgi:hypothetical protein